MYDVTDLSMLGINNNYRRPTRLVFNRDTRDLLSNISKDVENNNIFNRMDRYGDEPWSLKKRKITFSMLLANSYEPSSEPCGEGLGYRVYGFIGNAIAFTGGTYLPVDDKHRQALQETLSMHIPSLESMKKQKVQTRSASFFEALMQATEAFFMNQDDVCYLVLYCPTNNFRKCGVKWFAIDNVEKETYEYTATISTNDFDVMITGPPLAAFRKKEDKMGYEPVLADHYGLDATKKFDKALNGIYRSQKLSDVDIVTKS
jgi:hypothetical protein